MDRERRVANTRNQGSICRQGRQGYTLAGKTVTPSEKFPQKCSQGRLLTLAEGHVRLLIPLFVLLNHSFCSNRDYPIT